MLCMDSIMQLRGRAVFVPRAECWQQPVSQVVWRWPRHWRLLSRIRICWNELVVCSAMPSVLMERQLKCKQKAYRNLMLCSIRGPRAGSARGGQTWKTTSGMVSGLGSVARQVAEVVRRTACRRPQIAVQTVGAESAKVEEAASPAAGTLCNHGHSVCRGHSSSDQSCRQGDS